MAKTNKSTNASSHTFDASSLPGHKSHKHEITFSTQKITLHRLKESEEDESDESDDHIKVKVLGRGTIVADPIEISKSKTFRTLVSKVRHLVKES